MAVLHKKKDIKIRKSPGDRIVDVMIYTMLGLVAVSAILPFLYILGGSFATNKELTEKAFFIIPEVWSLNAYKYAVRTANILRGLKNSIILTVLGTALCMVFTILFAYPLSKPHFRGRNLIMNMDTARSYSWPLWPAWIRRCMRRRAWTARDVSS